MSKETEAFVPLDRDEFLSMLKEAAEKSLQRELFALGRIEEDFCYCGVFSDGKAIKITDVIHSIGPDDIRVFFSIGKERFRATFNANTLKDLVPIRP